MKTVEDSLVNVNPFCTNVLRNLSWNISANPGNEVPDGKRKTVLVLASVNSSKWSHWSFACSVRRGNRYICAISRRPFTGSSWSPGQPDRWPKSLKNLGQYEIAFSVEDGLSPPFQSEKLPSNEASHYDVTQTRQISSRYFAGIC